MHKREVNEVRSERSAVTPVRVAIVDNIGDVLALPAGRWLPPPATLEPRLRASIAGICPIERHVVLGLRTRALAAEGEPSLH